MRCLLHQHVDAPPVAAFQALPLFPSADSAAVGNGGATSLAPPGPGTHFREFRLVAGRRVEVEQRVVEFDPPRLCVLEFRARGFLGRTIYRLTPDIAGTLVELEYAAAAETWLARWRSLRELLGGRRAVRDALAGELRAVRSRAEASARRDGALGSGASPRRSGDGG